MTSLILYSRSYCHLCEDMQVALTPFKAQFDIDLKVIDVDTDPHLVALYDERVPVLAVSTANGEVREICHHFLNVSTLQTVLTSLQEARQTRGPV